MLRITTIAMTTKDDSVRSMNVDVGADVVGASDACGPAGARPVGGTVADSPGCPHARRVIHNSPPDALFITHN